jgi:DNA-binding LacI/PurR family transcriptional regulator
MATNLTIKDIAKLAGVSHATVSRVLNNSAKIKPETRERILAIVRDLNFSRNASARSLSSGRKFTIGMLILYDPFERRYPAEFLPAVLAGMTTELNAHGYTLTLFFDQIQDQRDQVPSRRLSRNHMDGLFVLSLEREAAIAHKVASVTVPVVLVNQRIEGLQLSSVIADDEAGGYAATIHLLGLGHTKIAFVEGVPHHGSNIDRKAGYRRALEAQGLRLDPGLDRVGHYDEDGGYRAATELLDAHPDLTAIFSANDIMAVGVYRAIKERGRRIPEDIAVVGYDDSVFAPVMEPPLTSVRKPRTRMGQTAASMMLTLMDAESGGVNRQEVVLPTELVVRRSTSSANRSSLPRA